MAVRLAPLRQTLLYFLSADLTALAIRDETGLRSTLLNRESKEEKMHSKTGFEKFSSEEQSVMPTCGAQ